MLSAFRHLPRTSEISSDPVSVVISQITQHEFSIFAVPSENLYISIYGASFINDTNSRFHWHCFNGS